jgi:hypothetical protein
VYCNSELGLFVQVVDDEEKYPHELHAFDKWFLEVRRGVEMKLNDDVIEQDVLFS